MTNHDKAIMEILGRDAFHSGNFTISKDVENMARTLNYLFTQLQVIKGMRQDEHVDHIPDVMDHATRMLTWGIED